MEKRTRDLISENNEKQATGIEPASSAWEADVLPMNYACLNEHIDYSTFVKKIKVFHLNKTYVCAIIINRYTPAYRLALFFS